MVELNKYRIYCTTEDIYVYKWDKIIPTTCPNNQSHIIDTNSITIIDSITSEDIKIINQRKDFFNNMEVTQKTNLFHLKSVFGFDYLNNNFTTIGNSTITNNIGDAEYKMSVNNTGDLVSLSSKQYGKYVAGYSSDVGIAIRMISSLVNDQECLWGYFDDNNGYYFKKTSDNFYVCILNDGVETIISSTNFNYDKLDGTGKSRYNLDFTKGNIYKIEFVWYGFGSIIFSVIGIVESFDTVIPIHIYTPSGSTSTKNSHLPITVKLDNNTNNTSCDIYVAGRQFSIIGNYKPIYRDNSAYITNITIGSTMLPLLSIKKKNLYTGIEIKTKQININSSDPLYIEFRTDSILTNSTFNNLLPSFQSCVTYDSLATSITGGTVIWSNILKSNNNSVIINTPFDNLTICGKSISGITPTLSYLHFTWEEEW
jgi:hypothetical protein